MFHVITFNKTNIFKPLNNEFSFLKIRNDGRQMMHGITKAKWINVGETNIGKY